MAEAEINFAKDLLLVMAYKIQKYVNSGVAVVFRHGFERTVADAAFAADKHHAGGAKFGHCHRIMSGS